MTAQPTTERETCPITAHLIRVAADRYDETDAPSPGHTTRDGRRRKIRDAVLEAVRPHPRNDRVGNALEDAMEVVHKLGYGRGFTGEDARELAKEYDR